MRVAPEKIALRDAPRKHSGLSGEVRVKATEKSTRGEIDAVST